jgi:4-amino-4-deoxy-L-arabinose transferase-like glycosyltransferase
MNNTNNPVKTESSTHSRFWEWLGLFSILALAAGLRLWGLDQNGYGNSYYAAAVRSMMMNWHNFFYVSFDPVGWVTVDKPPVSLWVQTLSAKLLGFSGFSLIFPQVVEGTLSVALVYFLVRRRFDAWAAFIAALAIAVGPISVAVDRYNNTDECLVFVLLLAAWAMSFAVEKSSRGLLLLALALVGVGFNTKMMVAFIVLPTFYLIYWVGAAVPWKRRFADLTIGSLVLAVVALSWPLAVDFTPASERPFVGSTQDNSMISLSLGWNGFQRLLSRRRGGPVIPAATPTATTNAIPTPAADSAQATQTSPQDNQRDANGNPVSQNRRGNRRAGLGGMSMGQPGPLRLADPNMAGQIIWFLPLVFLGLWAAVKKVPFRWPLEKSHCALLLWFVWFLTYTLVFSFMKGGMHTYYIVMLAPPLAALTGIGARTLWTSFIAGEKHWFLLPAAFLLTVAWQVYIWSGYPHWQKVVWPVLLAGIGLSVIGLTVLRGSVQKEKISHRWLPLAFGLGLFTLFISPTVWSLTAVLAPDRSVEANPNLLSGNGGQGFGGRGGFGEETNNQKLISFLEANQSNAKYLVVAQNSQSVSSIIIQTGLPAISIGGFMGGDPTLTLDQFIAKVKAGEFRYMLVGGMGRGGFGGPGNNGGPNGQRWQGGQGNRGGRTQAGGGGWGGGPGGFGDPNSERAKITQWVRDHGKLVDPSLWRVERPRPETADSNPIGQGNNKAPSNGFGGGQRGMGGLQLYELNS